MSEEEHTLRAARGRRAVEEWALVLAAAGIAHRVAGNAGSWRLLVAAGDADRSIAALDAYDAERRNAAPGEEVPEYGPTYAGLLAAGAGGNVLNAFLHGAHHSAVGASTAVFGAIGLLGGLQFGRKRRRRGAWLPVAGTLALLAMLGSDCEADIVAHLFGLLVGGVLGVAAALLVARPPGRPAQWALAGAALAAVAGSWLVALRAL